MTQLSSLTVTLNLRASHLRDEGGILSENCLQKMTQLSSLNVNLNGHGVRNQAGHFPSLGGSPLISRRKTLLRKSSFSDVYFAEEATSLNSGAFSKKQFLERAKKMS